jgi:hypothetical protein
VRLALETAINTYTDAKSGHKIFNSETDLNYPPDRMRFWLLWGPSMCKDVTQGIEFESPHIRSRERFIGTAEWLA